MTFTEGIPHILEGRTIYRGAPGHQCLFCQIYNMGSPTSSIVFGMGWDMNDVKWLDRALNRQDLEVDDWQVVPGQGGV